MSGRERTSATRPATTTSRARVAAVTLALLTVPLAGCLGDDVSVVWDNVPSAAETQSEFSVTFNLEDAGDDVGETGVRYGTSSVPEPESLDDYTSGVTASSTSENATGPYSATVSTGAAGTLYLRAYTLVDDEPVWSEERTVTVEAPDPDDGEETPAGRIGSVTLSASPGGPARATLTWTITIQGEGSAATLEIFGLQGSGTPDEGDSSVLSVSGPELTGSRTVDLEPGLWSLRARAVHEGGDTLVSRTVTVTVEERPPTALTANAGGDRTVGDPDGDGTASVTLDGTGSQDPEHNITGYRWTRDGETLGTGASLTVDLDIGEHNITLTVTNDAGDDDSDTVRITVVANRPPVARASPTGTFYDADGDGSEDFTLSGATSSDPDGPITAYSWTQGGTEIGTTAELDRTLEIGTHRFNLTVTDEGGASATTAIQIIVAPNRPPTATFEFLCDGMTCIFSGNGSVDPDGGNITYDWDMDDGSSKAGKIVQHNFAASGTYNVTLTVTDEGGAQGTHNKDVTLGMLVFESPHFDAGGQLPARFTCDGAGESPGLNVTGAHRSAQDFVLFMVDRDEDNETGGDFVHWVVWDIPVASGAVTFANGSVPDGATQGINDANTTGYEPPCPPPVTGGEHRYAFTFYAVSVDIPTTANRTQVEQVINNEDNVLQKATILGRYTRALLP